MPIDITVKIDGQHSGPQFQDGQVVAILLSGIDYLDTMAAGHFAMVQGGIAYGVLHANGENVGFHLPESKFRAMLKAGFFPNYKPLIKPTS